jgi:hypothetical protein
MHADAAVTATTPSRARCENLSLVPQWVQPRARCLRGRGGREIPVEAVDKRSELRGRDERIKVGKNEPQRAGVT